MHSQVMGPSVAEEDMDRLREMMEELETYFEVEEEQEGEAQPIRCQGVRKFPAEIQLVNDLGSLQH